MNILIVGAGPAGLALADFLDTEKHTVTLIEREKEFKTMGYGIYFYGEGKRILQKATHDPRVQSFLRQIGFIHFLKHTGETLGKSQYNKMFHISPGDSITSIKRENLHNLLQEHLPKDVDLRMGTTIRNILNTNDHAYVELSDGTKEHYDLVVAADGARSTLREMFFSFKTVTLPCIARYFWLDRTIPRFLIEWSEYGTIMCMPHKNHTTMLSIESTEFNHCNNTETVPEHLRTFYRSIDIDNKEIEECYKHSHISSMRYIYTRKWYNKRVVLIGDAQHAMTPTRGFGTTTALEDALQLAETLNNIEYEEDLQPGLQKFASRRTRRIRILRTINRAADFLTFNKSKRFFRFFAKHNWLAMRIETVLDLSIRIGLKYA